MAPQGMRVCPGCGIIAPFARGECSGCKTPFGATPPVAAARVGTAIFACIHDCTFACTACGMRSPIGGIELEGQAECMRCGLVQAFDVVQWTEALKFCHDTVDLSGPHPEGQNPVPGRSIAGKSDHLRIGHEYTSSTQTQNSLIMDARGTRKHTLATTVSPGHPLCKTCHVPLEVSLDGSGGTRTRCPQCNDGAVYALPANAAATYGPLRGIIASDQRTDKPVAKTTRSQTGVEQIVCPQCGATLEAGAGETVKCTFCSTMARVPGRLARRQKQGEPPPMVPFWILLDGYSAARKNLLRGKAADDDDDDDDDDDSDFGAPGYHPNFAPTGVPSWAHPAAQQAAMANARPKSAAPLIIGLAIGAVVLMAGLGFGVAIYLSNVPDDPPPRAAPPPGAPAPAPPPAKTAPKRH